MGGVGVEAREEGRAVVRGKECAMNRRANRHTAEVAAGGRLRNGQGKGKYALKFLFPVHGNKTPL